MNASFSSSASAEERVQLLRPDASTSSFSSKNGIDGGDQIAKTQTIEEITRSEDDVKYRTQKIALRVASLIALLACGVALVWLFMHPK